MYIHIGKETIIKSNKIIIIIDLEKMCKKKKIEEILRELNLENNIIDISNKNNKSLIIIKEDKIKG